MKLRNFQKVVTCLKDTGARNFLSITLFLQRVSSEKNVRGVKKKNGVPNFFVPKRSVPNGVCLTEKNIVLGPAPSPART